MGIVIVLVFKSFFFCVFLYIVNNLFFVFYVFDSFFFIGLDLMKIYNIIFKGIDMIEFFWKVFKNVYVFIKRFCW